MNLKNKADKNWSKRYGVREMIQKPLRSIKLKYREWEWNGGYDKSVGYWTLCEDSFRRFMRDHYGLDTDVMKVVWVKVYDKPINQSVRIQARVEGTTSIFSDYEYRDVAFFEYEKTNRPMLDMGGAWHEFVRRLFEREPKKFQKIGDRVHSRIFYVVIYYELESGCGTAKVGK